MNTQLIDFSVFNSIHWKKSDSPKTLNREEYDVIYGQPLSDLRLPKAELNIKNSTRRRLCRRLVEFLINSIYLKKSVPPDGEKVVVFQKIII